MKTLTNSAQADFYKRFIMARGTFRPQDFGIDMDKEQFIDQMCEEFNNGFRSWTIDEMLLHPRSALRFCDDVRHKFGYHDLPDDIILRVILTRRKNPV